MDQALRIDAAPSDIVIAVNIARVLARLTQMELRISTGHPQYSFISVLLRGLFCRHIPGFRPAPVLKSVFGNALVARLQNKSCPRRNTWVT